LTVSLEELALTPETDTSNPCQNLLDDGQTEHISSHWDLTRFDGVLLDEEVHVWQADFADVQATQSLHWLLDQPEHSRASRFKVVAAHDQFVISRAFLRLAVAGYLRIDPRDVRFHITEHGKPQLAGDGDIRFNLSHTDGVAALAITRTRAVGIDVERIKQNVETLQIADRFFSRMESDWLHSRPASELVSSFFACWTAKEACVKACGTGLSMPLRQFSVIPGTAHNTLEFEISCDLGHLSNFTIRPLDLGPDLRGAVAFEGKGLRVRVGKWRWP
jgi:4'-phosphopantetheinyl transferase